MHAGFKGFLNTNKICMVYFQMHILRQIFSSKPNNFVTLRLKYVFSEFTKPNLSLKYIFDLSLSLLYNSSPLKLEKLTSPSLKSAKSKYIE